MPNSLTFLIVKYNIRQLSHISLVYLYRVMVLKGVICHFVLNSRALLLLNCWL